MNSTNQILARAAKAVQDSSRLSGRRTAALGVGLAAVHVFVCWSAMQGRLSLSLAFYLNTLIAYLIFTPLHDATHGAVAGPRAEWRWLQGLTGYLGGLVLWAPFSAFKPLHLRHHSETNQPHTDPDFWMHGHNPVVLVMRAFLIIPVYYVHFFKHSQTRSGRTLLPLIRDEILVGCLFAAWGLYSGWIYPVALWLLPAVFALALLALLFDWLPHHPHHTTQRLYNTSVYAHPLLSVLLLNQNYHLVHHLFPRVPFFAYGRAYVRIRGLLQTAGSPVYDLAKDRASADG
ncbi:MAG: fatty acid desaturase [Leptospiraceae bacterium]|nr:fatty acid desaturase [Leptospiraceae bacterium]